MAFAIHYGVNVWGIGRTKNSAQRHAEATIRVYNSLAPALGKNQKRNPDLRVATVSREVARSIRENGGWGAVIKHKIK